ncbi:hypothetical protein OCUBac02_50380 (plasmid) [Bosea sp. ANAM02]|nr:hypothetical protein OCUBac02_50380 [Bosea sp. ANAM02]
MPAWARIRVEPAASAGQRHSRARKAQAAGAEPRPPEAPGELQEDQNAAQRGAQRLQ